jgi:hypothetical protein
MTREQLLERIREVQARLDGVRGDPLQSHSEALAVAAPLLRELSTLQDQLRRLDAAR